MRIPLSPPSQRETRSLSGFFCCQEQLAAICGHAETEVSLGRAISLRHWPQLWPQSCINLGHCRFSGLFRLSSLPVKVSQILQSLFVSTGIDLHSVRILVAKNHPCQAGRTLRESNCAVKCIILTHLFGGFGPISVSQFETLGLKQMRCD